MMVVWQVAEVATYIFGGIDGGGFIDSGGDGIGISNSGGNDEKINSGLFEIIMVLEICTMTVLPQFSLLGLCTFLHEI